jgi:hypothetical protein
MEIWLDLTCNLTHTGSYDFKGSFGRHITFMNEISQKQEPIKEDKEIEEKKE